MLNRWAVAWVCLGVLGGAAFAGRPVTAQANPYPFAVGDRIQVRYENDRVSSCAVGEIRGLYIRCDRPDTPSLATRIGVRPRETWLSLASVIEIGKQLD